MDRAKTPFLFGIDPDETWDYIPLAVRGTEQKTGFVLRAPSLAAATKREQFLAEIAKAANEAAPGASKVIREAGAAQGLPPLAEDASAEEKAQRHAVAEAMREWLKAWAEAVEARADEERALTERYISEGLVGWHDLPSGSGALIDYEANKGRIFEVLRGEILTELCDAIARGATLSREEKVGLQSPQESQSA